MVYTEIKERNGKKYFYRVISVRYKSKVGKKRVYMGQNLSASVLAEKEAVADQKLFLGRENRANKKINEIKPKIIKILKENNVKKAGIFGSYARGDFKKNSDVDILIQLPKGMGFGFVGIKLDLEKGIKRKVDLVTYKSLHPLLKERILKEEVRII